MNILMKKSVLGLIFFFFFCKNKSKFHKNCVLLKCIISSRGSHCGYLPRASKNPSYATSGKFVSRLERHVL